MAKCERCGGLVVLEGRIADVRSATPADVEAVLALSGRRWQLAVCELWRPDGCGRLKRTAGPWLPS